MMAIIETKVYRKYLTTNKNEEKILYIRLQKALYGQKSVIIIYKKLLSDLMSTGFESNPYNPCMVNKMAEGSQMTVTWHIDHLMVSHKNIERIDEVADKLKQQYGNIKSKKGKAHDNLGM